MTRCKCCMGKLVSVVASLFQQWPLAAATTVRAEGGWLPKIDEALSVC